MESEELLSHNIELHVDSEDTADTFKVSVLANGHVRLHDFAVVSCLPVDGSDFAPMSRANLSQKNVFDPGLHDLFLYVRSVIIDNDIWPKNLIVEVVKSDRLSIL